MPARGGKFLVPKLPLKQINIWYNIGNDERLHHIYQHLSGIFFRVITELTGKCTAQEEKIHQVRKEKLIFFAFKMFLVISFVYFRSVVNFFVLQLEFLCQQGVSLYEEDVRVRSVMSSLPWNENRTIICTILVSAIGPKICPYLSLSFFICLIICLF